MCGIYYAETIRTLLVHYNGIVLYFSVNVVQWILIPLFYVDAMCNILSKHVHAYNLWGRSVVCDELAFIFIGVASRAVI